jgi:anaerobic magnesium-protoporphyrin IX monomethyl ester cyclase
VDHGIIDDERDWQKWFKCTDIDPTALPGPQVNRLRMKGYALLFANRLFKRPLGTYRLLRTFGRHMKATDILKLLASPFRRRTLTRKPELPARMVDAGLEEPRRTRSAAPEPLPPLADAGEIPG